MTLQDKAVAVCSGHVSWAFKQLPMGNIRVVSVTGHDSYFCYCGKGADYFLQWKVKNNHQWGVSSSGKIVVEMTEADARETALEDDNNLKLYHRIYPGKWEEVTVA